MHSPLIRTFLQVVPLAAILFLMSAREAGAEIPMASKEDLHASASHAIHGTVKRTYERKETQPDHLFTYGIAEIAVERVDKGSDIAVNDTVCFRYWGKRWIGTGTPPPDHDGHWNVPAANDSVEV